METTSDVVKEMVKLQTGNEPQIHEPTCVLWKAEHGNCKGCQSELPYCQMVSVMLATLQQSMYTPTSFQDLQDMMKKSHETMDKILEAKTTDEVKALT